MHNYRNQLTIRWDLKRDPALPYYIPPGDYLAWDLFVLFFIRDFDSSHLFRALPSTSDSIIMQSLFPNRPTSGANVLISFNAGKCNLSTVGINGKIKVPLIYSLMWIFVVFTV
jgi:hypothetical protein